MFKLFNNSKGFTLVELLVVVVILTIITALSSEFLINMLGIAVKTNNKTSGEEDYTFLDLKLSKIIQDSVSIGCGSSSCIGSNYLTFTRGAEIFQLSIATPTIFFKKGSDCDYCYQALNNNNISNFRVEVNNTERPFNIDLSFDIVRDSGNARLNATTTFDKKFILLKTR